MTYYQTREKYPRFLFREIQTEFTPSTLTITYCFSIPGLSEFRPTWTVPLPVRMHTCNQGILRQLIFSLGMVELVSYWKITCSPVVEVQTGQLDDAQTFWWKKLYFNGLGEFFHVNGIQTDINAFMELRSSGEEAKADAITQDHLLSGCLIPIGGGKDSAVTLEMLKEDANRNCCFFINERESSRRCAQIAGYPPERIHCVKRTLDPAMLELNRQGFLNGHTPFSAIAAFSSVLVAYLTRKKYVVLSNEASANDPSLSDSEINHQYSKSFAFEADLHRYLRDFIPCGVEYFSLLRPLSELQIASIFSRFPQYHTVFRSCNRGSKQDIWCANCPKCLFVCLILLPFLTLEQLNNLFGRSLLEERALLGTLEQLTGIQPNKPFECVGSREEVNAAICLGIAQLEASGIGLPYLLEQYKMSPLYPNWKEFPNPYPVYFNREHLLPPYFEDIVKKYAGLPWELAYEKH